MDVELKPLIDAHYPTGEERVNHADLAAELEALHPHSFGWAMACCERRREMAEDVLHDVYVKVLAGEARFDGRSSFKTWLFGVVRRTASSLRRRHRLHTLLGLHDARRVDGQTAAPTPEDDAVSTDRRERTRRALSALSVRQREVLHLVFYQDLTIEEAAAIMSVSVGSARTHYHRGKARMAALLSGDRQ
jgi:RNA polymerase sigma-70 factor (ECF subfamily)